MAMSQILYIVDTIHKIVGGEGRGLAFGGQLTIQLDNLHAY